jgi:hypothetical protein
MKTPDPLSSGHSAFLGETEETPENTEQNPDDPELVPGGDIQMEHSSD